MIQAESITRVYNIGGEEIRAVNDLSLNIDKGEFLSIVGPSGSGKTTLLHLLGLLDSPDVGRVVIDGMDMSTLSPTSSPASGGR